jgi:hypothetical protein
MSVYRDVEAEMSDTGMQILEELREIKFHLSVLTHSVRFDALTKFYKEILQTDPR